VLGLDISAPLVARAEERRRALGVGNLAFALGDAQVHRFEPARADLAASRFGVMFFADPVAAFRNLARGLRPGGRVVFVAWAGPEQNPFFTLPMQAATARLGPAAPADPDAPGAMAFRNPDRVLGILAAAGLADARATPFAADLHHPGGLQALLRFLPNAGPIARLLREKNGTDADREAILADLATALAPFETSDGIRIPGAFLL
jgi:SAM-dependent methyltransferase